MKRINTAIEASPSLKCSFNISSEVRDIIRKSIKIKNGETIREIK